MAGSPSHHVALSRREKGLLPLTHREMNSQKTMPIPKVALIGLYDPVEDDEPANSPVYSQGVERQEIAVQMSYLIAQHFPEFTPGRAVSRD